MRPVHLQGQLPTAKRARRLPGCLATVAIVVLLVAGGAPAPAGARLQDDIAAGGAFTCDFSVDRSFPMDRVAPVIERDRMYMTQRPGMLHKHIPFRPDPATGNFFSGGRYLFDSYDNAKHYRDWVFDDFVLDGRNFFDRPEFIDPDCRAWSTIGARHFADIHDAQVVFRTERFAVPEENQRPLLMDRWPAIAAEAEARGLTGVWLLYDKPGRLVSLVYFADRVGADTGTTDALSLATLEAAAPLGELFDDQPWTRTFDRTTWTLTIWFPFETGDQGEPSLWPNSPVLPEPGPSDGVCSPSRGENHSTAPDDCTPECGDGEHDPGEDNQRCPSDVPAS